MRQSEDDRERSLALLLNFAAEQVVKPLPPKREARRFSLSLLQSVESLGSKGCPPLRLRHRR
jgi:hypothetical protein